MPAALLNERFIGKQLYTLDDKGRITIPKHWRLKGEESEQWCLVPESRGNCLRLMDPTRCARFIGQAEERFAADQAGLRLFRSFFVGAIEEVETDKQGRIAIPAQTRTEFSLEKEVWMRGTGDLIEIWNKQRLEEHEEAQRARYRELANIVGA